MDALSRPDLERTLMEVGAHLADPPAADLAVAVGRRLEREASAGARPGRLRIRRPVLRARFDWRVAAAVAAAVAILAAGILVASPGVRRAVAGWLGIRGVRIEVTPTPPPSLPPSGPQAIHLGPPVSLAEAERDVGFRIVLPSTAGLGVPDEVHVQPLYISEQVFLVYRSRPGLPTAGATGLAALVSEFRAQPDGAYYKKLAAGTGVVRFVRVHGEPGYWIEGGHEVWYVDANGVPMQDTARIAGNVLVWQHGDLTLRLEGAFTEAQGLRIARSFG